jgi:hypothetical protein
MHRTDGANHSSNMFEDRDLVTPTPGTQIEKHWLNAVQEELVNILVLCGVTPVKGTWTQLRDVLVNKVTNQVIAGLKTFTQKVVIGTGPTGTQMLEVQGDSGMDPLVKIQNSANAVALQVQSVNGKPTMRITAHDGSVAPSSYPGVAGDMIFVGGVYNKLYVHDGTIWNACW